MKHTVSELLRDPASDGPPDEATVAAEAEVFLAEHPWSEMRAVIKAGLATPAPPWWRRLLPSGPVAAGLSALAAAAITIVVFQDPGPSVRPKGGADLSFVVRRGDAVVPGDPEALYHAGDRLQLRYSTAAHTHVLVVGRDGRGEVAPWYDDDGLSVAIAPGRDKLLQGSVILDESPGPERVYACFSRLPIPVSDLTTSVSRGIAPPSACEMVELTLRKP